MPQTPNSSFNDRLANEIAKTVRSMWMFYASITGFAVWMAGLGVTVAGDHYRFNLTTSSATARSSRLAAATDQELQSRSRVDVTV